MTFKHFERSFNISRGEINDRFLDATRKLLQLLMLRRMKHSPGVDLKLPPKTEVVLFVPMTKEQRLCYTRLITGADSELLHEIFYDAAGKECASFTEDNEKARTTEQSSRELTKFREHTNTDTSSHTVYEDEEQQRAKDQKIEKASSTWRTLMNLVLQLRKVGPPNHLISRQNLFNAGLQSPISNSNGSTSQLP